MKKEGSRNKIISYPDMSQLDETLLRQLVDNEREYWGHTGYSEYVVCTNIECRRLQSIEDVYSQTGKTLAELEREGPTTPDCPSCGEVSEIFFEPEVFVTYTRNYLANNFFGAILIDQNERLRGHAVSKKGPRHELFNELNYRQSFDSSICLLGISEVAAETTIDEQGLKEAIFMSRIGVDANLRGKGYYFALSKAMFDLYPEYDELPIISETRFDSELYPLFKAMGYHNLQTDQYDHIFMVHPNSQSNAKRDILSLSKDEFKARFGKKLKRFRSQREDCIKKRDAAKKPKQYIGMPSIRQVVEGLDL